MNSSIFLSKLIVSQCVSLMIKSFEKEVRLHNQLAELVADRYGYLATRDLNVCVTAFFKMAS